MNNSILEFEYKRISSARKSRLNEFQARGYEVLTFLLLVATASLLLFPNVPLIQSHQVSFIALLLLVVQTVLNFILLLRTLLRATSVAGRERTSAWNWEAFVLTGVDADTVIVGKWAAVVRSFRREFLILGILRGFAFPVAIMLHQIHSDYPYLAIANGRYSLLDYTPTLPNLLIGIAAVMLLTFAQLPLMAAIGVLAASRRSNQASHGGRSFSTWMLIMLGTAVIITLAFFAYNQFIFEHMDETARYYSTWLAMDTRLFDINLLSAITLVDTGILSPALLITSIFYNTQSSLAGVVSSGLILVIYGFWTWAALRLSIVLSRRQGMMKASSPSTR